MLANCLEMNAWRACFVARLMSKNVISVVISKEMFKQSLQQCPEEMFTSIVRCTGSKKCGTSARSKKCAKQGECAESIACTLKARKTSRASHKNSKTTSYL